MKTIEPKTIDEAINEIEEFLQCDMWSKFKDKKIKGKILVRDDKFKKEEDMQNYLKKHFDILRKEIKRIKRKELKNK
jgi:hypothetical protein